MIFAGLDLSLTGTGVCLMNRERIPYECGVIDPKKARGPARLVLIRDAILRQLGDDPCVIAVEGYSMGSKGRVFHIGELGGVIRVALMERGNCAVLTVPPAVLKKFATGKGNADKARMIAAAGLCGFRTHDDNEADAYFLARMALAWQRRACDSDGQAALVAELFPEFPTAIPRAPVLSARRRRLV